MTLFNTGDVFIHRTGQHMCIEEVGTNKRDGTTYYRVKLDDNSYRTYKGIQLAGLKQVRRDAARVSLPENVIVVDFQQRKRA